MNVYFKWSLEAPDNYNTKGPYSGQAVYVLFKPFLMFLRTQTWRPVKISDGICWSGEPVQGCVSAMPT